MVKRKEKTVIKNEEGVDPKRPRRSRRSSAGGGASPTKTRDGFYEFKPLMAFLISHLNWGYKPSKNKLKEWDYIIGDSEKGQDGEYMNDFFHEEEEVIDYCIKNNFKEKYAHLLSEADNPTMYSTEEVENEEDGDLEPPSKDKPSREFEAKTASKARLKKQAANKNDNIDTVEKSSEEQPRQKLGTKTSRLKRSKIKAEEAENDPVEESNEEQPRQKSGANRPKRKHLKNKAENEENDLVEESREKKPRRTSRAKRPTRSQPKIESENESDSDFDSNESSEELPRKRRGATKTGAKHDGGRGPVQERTCLHCNKVFSTKDGMKYHVDHFVCRIDECSDPVLVEKATQKRGRGKSSDSNSKRFRGTLEERTCPNCGRVFTSAHGMQYHSKRKVCQFPAVPEDQDQLLFHTLQPGEKFITIYGVVEVVKDDRETPTATRLANYKKVVINWQRSKGKREAQLSKAFISNAKFLRARRMKVNALYEKGNLKRASVFRAYFGEEPRLMKLVNRIEKPTTQQLQPDPMAPVSSFPDRIVECVLIPDRRAHYHGEDANSLTSKLTAVQDKACEQRMRTTRLFLKRRLLTERYNEDFLTFSCLDCGQGFASNAGLRYHISGGKNCTQQGAAISRVRKEKLAEVEEGAMDLLAGKHSAPRPRRVDRRIRRPDRKRKKESAMYPEVLLSLGYTLVKQDIKFTDDMKLPEPLQIQEDTNEDKIKETVTGSLSVDAPDALLGYLKKELVATQRKADDQKYGALYAEVFKTLGYWKPRRKRQSTRNGNDIDTSKRRRRALKSPPPPKPEPPIIDTRALADEVDSGRYPSMNRFKGDDHSNICKVCQDGGVLICCDFCTNAIHIACLRTKFTVKAPEPEDDFMCHNCIQTILSRRNRAEKRRLKKEARKVQRTEQRALEESKINSDIQQGMEYEFLAEKGKDTSELVELLQDAQVRLRQSLATAKMNNVRRRIMGCYFNNERDEN